MRDKVRVDISEPHKSNKKLICSMRSTKKNKIKAYKSALHKFDLSEPPKGVRT